MHKDMTKHKSDKDIMEFSTKNTKFARYLNRIIMITYQTEGTRMPDIKKRETTEWIKKVAATYGKKVGEIAYIHQR